MIKASSGPESTYTLSQFIALKDSDQITYRNFSILERSLSDPNIVYSINNVIYDYMDELKSYCKLVSVSDLDKIKYKYKPKLLSYEIYGSTEAYFMILAMNGMCNVKEFDLKDNIFKALSPSDMIRLINTIHKAESEHLKINRNRLNILES